MNTNVEDATELALNYLKNKAGQPFARVISVTHEDEKWIVSVDLGIAVKQIKRVIIDDRTKQVISYGE